MNKNIAIKPDLSVFAKVESYNISMSENFLGYTECKNKFLNTICFVQDNRNVWLMNERYSMSLAPFTENHIFFVPVRFLSAAFGIDIICDADSKYADICGERIKLKTKDCEVYISLLEVCTLLGKYYFESVKGIAIVSDTELDIKEELAVKGDQYVPSYIIMMNYIIYERPDAARILELFSQKNAVLKRPYIYTTYEKFEKIKELVKTNDVLKSWSEKIIEDADNYIASYTDAKQIFDYFTRFNNCPYSWDVMGLCLSYCFTGDDKYSDAAIKIAVQVAEFPTWSSRDHNISVCTPTDLCVAVLDFLYDKLGSQEKYTILSALYNKTVVPAFKFYSKEYQPQSPAHFRTNNWNSSANSAVVAAALAVMSEFAREECGGAIEKAIVCMERVLHNFAPDGGWTESLGYWGAAVSDTVQMISNLINALGSDFSLSKCPGMSQTGYFPFYATGNAGGFAFHDTHPREAKIYAPEIFWFAQLTEDASLSSLYRELLVADDAPVRPNNILYYYDGGKSASKELTLDKHFGKVEIATMRSDWSRDKSNVFVAVHAGYNSEIHGHFDIGSFEYHTYNFKFATELGSDDYNLPDYWNRVGIYAQRAEGHNVYVLDPDEGPGQNPDGDAVINCLYSRDDEAAYTVDMTSAYSNRGITKATRLFSLSDGRKIFTVKDEIESDKTHEAHWLWHTDADITVNPDGKSAVLDHGGDRVTLYFDSNSDFEIISRRSTPFEASPDMSGQLSNMEEATNLIDVVFNTLPGATVFRCVAVPKHAENIYNVKN